MITTKIRKIELKTGVTTRKMQDLWDALADMRRRPQWALFEQLLPVLLYGSPAEVKAVITGDHPAIARAVKTMVVMAHRVAA